MEYVQALAETWVEPWARPLVQSLDCAWSNRTQGACTAFIEIWIVSYSSLIFSFATSPIAILSIERESVWIISTTDNFFFVWLTVWFWSCSWTWTRCDAIVGPACGHIKSTIAIGHMWFIKLSKQGWKLICKFFLAFAFVILTEVWFISLALESLRKVIFRTT